jgi:hypothetical protein
MRTSESGHCNGGKKTRKREHLYGRERQAAGLARVGLARHCGESEGRRAPSFRDGASASGGEPRNDEAWNRCACARNPRSGCVIALSRSEEALLKSRMARAVFTAASPRTTTAPARPIRRSRRECRPRRRQALPPRRSRAQPRRPRPGPRSRDCGAHPSPST